MSLTVNDFMTRVPCNKTNQSPPKACSFATLGQSGGSTVNVSSHEDQRHVVLYQVITTIRLFSSLDAAISMRRSAFGQYLRLPTEILNNVLFYFSFHYNFLIFKVNSKKSRIFFFLFLNFILVCNFYYRNQNCYNFKV